MRNNDRPTPFLIDNVVAKITAAPSGYYTFSTMPAYTAIVQTPDGLMQGVPIYRPCSGPFWDADPAVLLLKPLPVGAQIRGTRVRAHGQSTPGEFVFDFVEAPKSRKC